MEGRIPGVEDKVEEMDNLVNENVKSKNQTNTKQKNLRNRDTRKRWNIRIISISEGKETLVKDTEHIFKKIIGEKFTNLNKEMSINIK